MHRRDVDDPAAAALRDHLLRRELRAEERALQVDVEDLLVLLLGGVEDAGARLDTGVVHHDVDPPEPPERAVDQLLQVGDLAHVGLDAERAVAERDDLALEILGGLVRVRDVVDDDVGALGRERERDRLADAAVAAGDDRDFSFETHAVWLLGGGRVYCMRSVRWSPTRIAFAIAVSAGFTAPMLGKKLVSTT